MTSKSQSIGFMQGRLTDLYDNKIQSFPWNNWEKEFELANKNDFKIMEWTIDSKNLFKNPLMNDEGLNKIKFLKNTYDLSIPSLTGDCFMQEPFWKSEGILNPSIVQKTWTDFVGGSSTNSEKVWNLLMFQVWNDSFSKIKKA